MTRKEQIIKILSMPGAKKTCTELCKQIIRQEKLKGSVAHYLSGSVSSILSKLVKDGILRYADVFPGPKGGHVYEINTVKKEAGE